MKLDEMERRILALLQQHGRMSNVELARQVGLSEAPCFRRVKNLEQTGIVSGYSARLDQRQLGLDVTAFVQVTMEKQSDETTEAFRREVEGEASIIECHAMSGGHDYLMKVVARSIDDFSEIVMRKVLKFPGVAHVESAFSLGVTKEAWALPA